MRRNPYFKNRREVLQFLLFAVLGVALPLALFFIGSVRYPLLDGDDRALARIVAVTPIVAIAIQLLIRKRLLGRQPALLQIVIILGMAVPITSAALGVFFIFNAALDQGKAEEVRFDVVGRAEPSKLMVRPFGSTGMAVARLDVGRTYWQAGPGSILALRIGPGFFGSPWIAGKQVVHPSGQGITPAEQAPSGARRSPARLLGTAVVIGLVIYVAQLAQRRQKRRRKPSGVAR